MPTDIFNMDPNHITLEEAVSLQEASLLSSLSQGHLAHLIRNGDLWGMKIGRNWVTTRKAVIEYLASNPRPGPKRKKIEN